MTIYQKRFQPTVIGVVGSVGKTGTKRAIAHVLSSSKHVAWQDGNYNDYVTVPLVYFGLPEPALYNPLAWLMTYLKMVAQLFKARGAEVVVLELGSDTPGDIAEFGKHLKLDYAVVTGVSHEHMEYFKTLEAVAAEELSVAAYTKYLFVDETVRQQGFGNDLKQVVYYGRSKECDVAYATSNNMLAVSGEQLSLTAKPKLQGLHQYAALAVAAALAAKLGLPNLQIKQAIETLTSMPGRMNVLKGKDGSLLIDDTYNSSPTAVYQALNFLYAQKSTHKIAVLGNMNEMGGLSPELHQAVGASCDSSKLDLVITIGPDANKYLAASAKKAGCQVKTFDSPYLISHFLIQHGLKDTAILFKGSQNRVFLEEAVKDLLANPEDQNKLVRQSPSWIKVKHQQFGDH